MTRPAIFVVAVLSFVAPAFAAAPGDEAPRPLTDRGLENLVALARLLGVVRHFHPADEAAAADWETIAIDAVRLVEPAPDDDDLVATLQAILRPVAPAVWIGPADVDAPLPPALAAPPDDADARIVQWEHHGYGAGTSPHSIYRSERRRRPPAFVERRRPEDPWRGSLSPTLAATVPLGVWSTDAGTRPPAAPIGAAAPGRPAGWAPSGDDRATRLADVILLWNVLRHFYPYFDVVDTDWDAALPAALRAAATDADAAAFLLTLRRLVAALHDGHGMVHAPTIPGPAVPSIAWAYVEDRVVVAHAEFVAADRVRRGDVVVSVDGVPARAALAAIEAETSGARAAFVRWRALQTFGRGAPGTEATLVLRRAGAPEPIEVRVPRDAAPGAVSELRRPPIDDLGDGIRYLDLDRVSDDDITAALPDLVAARGVVCDLRGYPRNTSTLLLAHLAGAPVTCAQWHVPVVRFPFGADVEFAFSNWTVEPAAPRIEAPVAFVTDARAISYAETWLGIVEAYGLADIVGAPTAGTNGNVNPVTLPGGYAVMWTGMKVLKHDGSRHHGVGILPTVPAARTIEGVRAGRDELLERAIETVRGRATSD